ncbi:helix-turn-helix domain-containing protein [Flavobacterium sp. ANB]|uniref:AraC family transcriptional regulator n=1 Tax=unclassified Flavobacterium TaxID=196869 RepID=UPI0012B702D7|nr:MULTISPECIES: AraC family transcriptional regulator [unclassified Flavobacterium]MBF4518906.1 helix-turn-helix domain-containing protein [Flavobacterium sp. ANB]MTD71381.1 helix-turn-helix domain-containing protein [Flavobacterium sp. LC2016-13]
MKTIIPLKKLNESTLDIMIDKMSDGFVEKIGREITKSHRNDFCACILPNNGKGTFFVDFKEVYLSDGFMLFLYPGQVQRIIKTQKIEGWVLFFDHNLIDDYSRSVLEESLYQGPVLTLSKEQKKWLFQLMELLYDTSLLNDMSTFHKPAIKSIVVSLIYKITSIYQASVTQDTKQYSLRSNTIVTAFRKLLRDNFKEVKSPAEYAGLMNLSLGYLNDTLKMVTGNTVSYSIQEEAIREAQRLLWYSDLSIKEIAATIGFDDPKYFSRIFSKITSKSPAQFRKSHLGE